MDSEAVDQEKIKQGYLYAVRLLAQSKRSEKELGRKLTLKGFPEPVIVQILERLKTQRILNDAKLVEETVEWSIRSKGHGRRRIFSELKRRGISEKQIGDALEKYPKEAERSTAEDLAKNRWAKLQKLEPRKRMKRLYDFLINRGFDFDLAREIVAHIEHEHQNV